jgi:hypothetical protein
MLTASDQVEEWSRGVLITVEVQTYLVLILFNPITPILQGSSTPVLHVKGLSHVLRGLSQKMASSSL